MTSKEYALIDAKQNVINAVLYLIYTSEVSAGRMSMDEGRALLEAQGQLDYALFEYVEVVTSE